MTCNYIACVDLEASKFTLSYDVESERDKMPCTKI